LIVHLKQKCLSLVLGFKTIVGIFGVTLLAPVLAGGAKDVLNNTPKPDGVSPSPPANKV